MALKLSMMQYNAYNSVCSVCPLMPTIYESQDTVKILDITSLR
jgi:hypothetical protein